MLLIAKLGTVKKGNYRHSFALFLYPYCNQKVKKRLCHGKTSKSCGCYTKKLISEKSKTHGDTVNFKMARLYAIRNTMIARCYNKNNISYKNYGGRGIKVCNQWRKSYIIFKIWAILHGYKDNLTIDRIKNDGNYEPGNCKFSTYKEQAQNRRNNKLNWKKVNQIRSLYKNVKISQTLLARIFNVTLSTINDIIHYRRWRSDK